MPERKGFLSAFAFFLSLALLALAQVAPIPSSDSAAACFPDYRDGKIALLRGGPSVRAYAVMADDAVGKMKAYTSENDEEEDAGAWDGPCVAFLNLCSFRQAPTGQAIAPRPILSLYPLRC